ncbi:MAG: sugar phosphate isomerase/epimerase [Anaerolineae bacterium]|nr:sugar phosphate isomerase/epimerase [Anaerolineae bacterium]
MTPPLGLQLYTLRANLAEDFENNMRRVAKIGFSGVEFGGFYGESAAAAANLCRELGLEICGMHSHGPLMENLTLTIDTAQILGVKRVVCPWYPPEDLATVDDIKKTCDELNTANEIMRGNNLTFGYHNHWAECYRVQDKYAYQHMSEFLDPTVFFEVDVYWARTAGVAPAAMLRELGARAPLLHIKDGPATMEGDMTAVGDGVLDFDAISAASKDTAQWWIVELDRCATDMLQAVDKSYQHITRRGLAHGR